jgi:CHRD domain
MSSLTTALTASLFATLFALVGCDVGTKGASTKEPTTKASVPKTLTARLKGASEVPPVATDAKGTAEVTLTTGNVINWKIIYEGLSGPAMGVHFHGPAASGDNAAVVVPMTGSLASPISGSATLTPGQTTDLIAGKWYVNVHSATNPNGEIRGQLEARP